MVIVLPASVVSGENTVIPTMGFPVASSVWDSVVVFVSALVGALSMAGTAGSSLRFCGSAAIQTATTMTSMQGTSV